MVGIKLCEECGVPLAISKELEWNDNGVISVADSPRNRMVLYESNVIDNLLKGIEDLIGLPIEHMVIESRRRELRRFIERSIPVEVREAVFLVAGSLEGKSASDGKSRESALRKAKAINREILDLGMIHGYGDARESDLWESGAEYPWRTAIVSNPYSLPFWVAEVLGTVEAFEGIDQRVEYEEIGDNINRVITYPGDHPVEFKERLKRRYYDFKSGDIEFERCSQCSTPLDVARLSWNLEEGTITDPDSGWRMAIYGPLALEAVLDDLEAELGDDIPEAVIEAERRYVKSRVGERNWRRRGTTFNRLSAMRGMGNIIRFEADEDHLSVTIQNSCLHLLMVGMAQAIYETAMGMESSTYEWDLAEDGDLSITIRI